MCINYIIILSVIIVVFTVYLQQSSIYIILYIINYILLYVYTGTDLGGGIGDLSPGV